MITLMDEPEIGLAALILAGGKSTRMGQDKVWLSWTVCPWSTGDRSGATACWTR